MYQGDALSPLLPDQGSYMLGNNINLASKKKKLFSKQNNLKCQKRPTVKMFVYKIKVNPIHTVLKCGDCYDFVDR